MSQGTVPTEARSSDLLIEWSLRLLGGLFCALGLVFFVRPHLIFAPIGLDGGPPALWAELRAAYGGLFGATGLYFGWSAGRPVAHSTALWLATLILGGFVLGRCLSWGLDGAPTNPIALGNPGLEVVGFGIALGLYRRQMLSG